MEFALLLLVLVCVLVLLYYKRTFGYWKRKNVPSIEPSFPFGNLGKSFLQKQGLFKDLTDVYFALKSQGYKHGGFYMITIPAYIPIHVDYVKNILAKDFNHFVNHGFYFNEKDDPLSAHLLSLEDEKWKNLRRKLTPTFTSGKMKMMFNTLKECVAPLIQEIDSLSARNETLDIKELVARFTTDVIGSCAFGIDCNSFKDPDADFRKYGRLHFETDFIIKMRNFILMTLPKLASFLRLKFTRKEVSHFFLAMVKNTVQYREENNVSRPDFMQLLINLKHTKDGLTLNEIAAQVLLFFLAGFETSSTTMTFCFYELAKNQDIQKKLRKEINSVLAKHNGDITYDVIKEMKYLGRIIDETLRKYPPLAILNRVCNKTYHVPESDVVIEKDTMVLIPVYAIQHDPEYFPNPEKFDPDRFSDENKQNRVPFTFLPFGEGPRSCLGLRFGLMQMKIGIITILRNFHLTINPKTPLQMKMDPNSIILTFQDTLYLDSEKVL